MGKEVEVLYKLTIKNRQILMSLEDIKKLTNHLLTILKPFIEYADLTRDRVV